jgi:hypothetical protein
VLAVQETHGYKWEGYIIFIHSRDTACNSHYTAPNDGIILNNEMGNDMEGSGHGLMLNDIPV